MLDFIGVSVSQLPKVLKSGEYVGDYKGIKIVAGAMDQIAGAIGVGAIENGVVSEMTGTTMAVFANVDEMPKYDENKKIPCHLQYDGNYCLLSWTATAGIALKWFKNNFCESYSFADLDKMAADVPHGSAGLTFLPYLCGATMPHYDPNAKGFFYGFTMEHTRAHAVRSILESIAFMLKENLEYLGVEYKEVRSTGGGAQSCLWCQIKADVLGEKIVTLKNEETACLGAAILAGVGTGIFESVPQAVDKAVRRNKTYQPSGKDYTKFYQKYCNWSEIILQERTTE
jgi:xylulokinase